MALTGREKALIFLSVLGAEASSKILRYLPEDMAELLASSLTALPHPSPQALQEVLEDYRNFNALPPPRTERHKPVIEEQPVEEKPVEPPPPPAPRDPRQIVLETDARRLASVLMSERPQLVGFLLLQFSEEKRQEILSNLPTLRSEIMKLMLDNKETVFSELVREKVYASLAERFKG